MAKKQENQVEETKNVVSPVENEKVEENKAQEEKAVEVKENQVEETLENTQEEKKEENETKEDAKIEENASNEKEDAEVQVKENIAVANDAFNDKYTGTKYVKGTEFVIVDEDVETTKIADKKYKISAKRAEQIKAKGFID